MSKANTTEVGTGNARQLQTLLTSSDGFAYFVPVDSFPAGSEEVGGLNAFFGSLVAAFRNDVEIKLEVIIRQNCLYTGLLNTFVDRCASWMPRQGLGLFPDRPAPHMPSPEEIEEMDPRKFDRGPSEGFLDFAPEFVFRVSEETAKMDCLTTMLGHGAISIVLTRLKPDPLFGCWESAFGKRVTDRLFKAISPLVPLFASASFGKASQEELAAWFDSLEVYASESFVDRGIVIASRHNIEPLLAELIRFLPPLVRKLPEQDLRW
jgi:hypothetical protein